MGGMTDTWGNPLKALVQQCGKSKEQLEREHIVRETLEAAIRKIEAMNVNSTYRQAIKKAVKIMREMKP